MRVSVGVFRRRWWPFRRHTLPPSVVGVAPEFSRPMIKAGGVFADTPLVMKSGGVWGEVQLMIKTGGAWTDIP